METAIREWAKERFDHLEKELAEIKNLFYTYILPRPVKGNEGR